MTQRPQALPLPTPSPREETKPTQKEQSRRRDGLSIGPSMPGGGRGWHRTRVNCPLEQEDIAEQGAVQRGHAAALWLCSTSWALTLQTEHSRTTVPLPSQMGRSQTLGYPGENRSPSARAPPSDSVLSTCSPGKKACRESIHVFISCPLNMFTLTYSGGSPSPSLQASRLRAPAQQPGERRQTDH